MDLLNIFSVDIFFCPIDNTVIEHVSCLGKALNSYYIGDTIVVFPGKYCLDGVFQLVDSVHITGKGNCSEIIGKIYMAND